MGIDTLWSGGRVPSSQLRITFAPNMPMRCAGNILRRSRRRSRSLFLGNIPETACRMIWRSREGEPCKKSLGPEMSKHTHLVRVFDFHRLVGRLLQASWEHRVFPEQQLLLLAPCDLHFSRVRNDNVVAAIHFKTVRGLSQLQKGYRTHH